MDLYQIQVRKEARSGQIHCGPERLRIVLCRFVRGAGCGGSGHSRSSGIAVGVRMYIFYL